MATLRPRVRGPRRAGGWLGGTLLLLCALVATPARAIEGTAAAGPIGGTDMRSALLPPPGFYAGSVQGYGRTIDFRDGEGRTIHALREAAIGKAIVAPFLYDATGLELLGGAVGVGATLPIGESCGRLSAASGQRCRGGAGDLYAEVDWGRFFGTLRPSKDAGAYPIAEGLAVLLGFGVLFPTGGFERADALSRGVSQGSNLWDFAPSVALTYTTPALIGEGTEISAKAYWNEYLVNAATGYRTGSLLDVDFAVSEHVGRVQAGLAGIYAVQLADDALRGRAIAPDGLRYETLTMGPVLAYDLPDLAASLKIKALRSVFTVNAPTSYVVVAGWSRKF